MLELCCDSPRQALGLLALVPVSLQPYTLVSLKGYCNSSLVVKGSNLTQSELDLLKELHSGVLLCRKLGNTNDKGHI